MNKLPKKIPRSLAFDLLFGMNKIDGHNAIDLIYGGFENQTCESCKYYTDENNFDECTEGEVASRLSADSESRADIPYGKDFGCNRWVSKDG